MNEKQTIAMDQSFEVYMDGVDYERAEDKLMNIIRTAYEAGYQAALTAPVL